MRTWKIAALAALAVGVAGCQTDSSSNSGAVASTSAPSGGTGATVAGSAGAGTSGGSTTPAPTSGSDGSKIPTLVSVNLQNVANNLSVSLQVNRNSIPVTAQVPIDVAANVCGVSVDALAASVANGHATCTATTTTPQLTQAVQQQISTGGNVTGGAQTMGQSGTP